MRRKQAVSQRPGRPCGFPSVNASSAAVGGRTKPSLGELLAAPQNVMKSCGAELGPGELRGGETSRVTAAARAPRRGCGGGKGSGCCAGLQPSLPGRGGRAAGRPAAAASGGAGTASDGTAAPFCHPPARGEAKASGRWLSRSQPSRPAPARTLGPGQKPSDRASGAADPARGHGCWRPSAVPTSALAALAFAGRRRPQLRAAMTAAMAAEHTSSWAEHPGRASPEGPSPAAAPDPAPRLSAAAGSAGDGQGTSPWGAPVHPTALASREA